MSINGSLRGEESAPESDPPSTASTTDEGIVAECCTVQNGHHANGGPASAKGVQSRLHIHSALHERAERNNARIAQDYKAGWHVRQMCEAVRLGRIAAMGLS